MSSLRQLLGWTVGGAVGGIVIPFLIGRMLARRSPGRELAACVAFVILDSVIMTTIPLYWLRAGGPLPGGETGAHGPLQVALSLMLYLLGITGLLAGAV